jgi:hypothetical protein
VRIITLCCYSGILSCVDLSVDVKFSKKHAASIFIVEVAMGAICFSETLEHTNESTWRHKPIRTSS